MNKLSEIWHGPQRAYLVIVVGFVVFQALTWFGSWMVAGIVVYMAALGYAFGYGHGATSYARAETLYNLDALEQMLERDRERIEQLAPDHPERRGWAQAREMVREARDAWN